MIATSPSQFLDGRVTVHQPAAGFRAGLDAVMLAAAVPAQPGEGILELGSGAGTVSLCLAARVPDIEVLGIEIDRDLVRLANANAAQNGWASRVRFVEGDALDLAGPFKRTFSHVCCNPPFHRGEGEPSPDSARNRSLRDEGALGGWLEAGMKRAAAGGTFTAILRADRLGEALARLPGRGVSAFPLWPRSGEAAKRVIVQARSGSRAPFCLLPGLILHRPDGSYTPEAEGVLRGMRSLALGA